MLPISVIVLTFNAEATIGATLASARRISDDVHVVDQLGVERVAQDHGDAEDVGAPAGKQAGRPVVPVAELVELIGEEGEHPLPVGAGGVAAVAVALAELLQLVVQIPHGDLLVA